LTEVKERKEKDRDCLLCGKYLEPSFDSDDCNYQPYGGGEIKFHFCFGSKKFDLCPGYTEYRAVVCDKCAANHVRNMEQRLFGMDGKEWTQEKQDEVNRKNREFYEKTFAGGKGQSMEEVKDGIRSRQGSVGEG
jgi:hypothetical protein